MRCWGKKFELFFSPSRCAALIHLDIPMRMKKKTNFPLQGVLENSKTILREIEWKKCERKLFRLALYCSSLVAPWNPSLFFGFPAANPWRPTLFVHSSSHRIAASLHDNDGEEEKFWILLMLARMLQLRRFVVCSFEIFSSSPQRPTSRPRRQTFSASFLPENPPSRSN